MTLASLDILLDSPAAQVVKDLLDHPKRRIYILEQAVRDGLPRSLVATMCFQLARDEADPDDQRRYLYRYLKLHCAEDLRVPEDASLVEMMGELVATATRQEATDFAIVALRAYSVDPKWYIGSRLDEQMLAWLTEQWGILGGLAVEGKRLKTAGSAGSAAHQIAEERHHQLERSLPHWTKEIIEGEVDHVRNVLVDFSKELERLFQWLTVQEQIHARSQLRLFQRLADRLQEGTDRKAIVETAEESRDLMEEVDRVRNQMLSVPESPIILDGIRLLDSLRSRLRSELARWGELVPILRIRPERGTYSFVDGYCEPVLLLMNDGVVALNNTDLFLLVDNGSAAPDHILIPRLEPGEEVRIAPLISAPPDAHRFSVQWIASNIQTGYGDAPEQDGSFDIESDHGLDWTAVAKRPNPYITKPVDDPERLFGRSEDLQVLERAIHSGESRYLTGQRRVGKTSLIRVLLDQLDPAMYLPIYAEWGEIGSTSGGGFAGVCASIAQKISYQAQLQAPELRVSDPPSLDEFQRSFNGSMVAYISEVIKRTGLHMVIAIDDFDDVPLWVYSGEEGELFFSMIKVLTGRRGLSLVFVGGQKLQRIMRSPVATKLNQVTPINLDYLGREAARDLITQPVKEVLHFDNRAIDRLYYWSSGNPFYANRICNQLWNHMVIAQHTHVIDSDVDQVVEEAARTDDAQLFSHFWHDGIWGDGSDEQQTTWESGNCLVLWSIGRLQAEDRASDYFPLDWIKREAHIADSDARQWVGDLVTRGVLIQHLEDPDQYRTVIRYFQLWLSRRGFSELYSFIDPAATQSLVNEGQVPDEDIEQILVGRNLRYKGESITPYDIRKFLDQFHGIENQLLILPLVRRLLTEGFVDESEVKKAAEGAMKQLAILAREHDPDFVTQLSPTKVWKNVFVVVADESSSKPMGDVVRQVASLSRFQIGDTTKLTDFVSQQTGHVAVLLFDDFIGTGSTAKGAVEKALVALDAAGLTEQTACVAFCAAVGFKDVIDHLNSLGIPKCRFSAERLLLPSDQAFDAEAAIYESTDDLSAALKLVEGIGGRLQPDNPLGFGGMQALVTSYRNTPNFTLPMFWKPSAKRSFQWKPLLRRSM